MSELPNKLRWWALDALTVGHLRADLLAAAGVVERADWRPIAEAPKDREIWLCGRMKDGSWYQERCRWWAARLIEDRGYWPVTFMSGYGEPSHWRELPAPPEVKP